MTVQTGIGLSTTGQQLPPCLVRHTVHLGGKKLEENFVSAVLQGGDGRAELGKLEKHVHHSLRPPLPLVVVDRQLLACGQGDGGLDLDASGVQPT